MALIDLHNIYKSYGEEIILSGASMQIHPKEKIGLVGDNGAGKTTILKIITGEETVDEGQVSRARDLKIGYLTQKPTIQPHTTLKEFLQESLGDLFAIRERLKALEKEMASPHIQNDKSRLESLMEEYGSLSLKYEAREGYNLEQHMNEVAEGMRFSSQDMARKMSEFSGGEKTRAQLASILLQDYDLLLLDEPTNNLDVETMEWLEKYLDNWEGTLLVVSHDRYFLNRIASKIALLEKYKIKCYKGNYSAFKNQKDLEDLTTERSQKKQHQEMQKDLEFIQNASSDEIRRAQSRQKQLEKTKPVEELSSSKNMKPKFDYTGRGSNIMLSCNDVTKSYGHTTIFSDVTFKLFWGDRAAVIGPNGSGKTTFLRLVVSEELPDGGTIKLGPSVKTLYYDQEHRGLNLKCSVLENIMEYSDMTESEARKYLGRYLFTKEDVFRQASDLSSGEKSRLALAKATLTDSNFLIMDEPTNFLDIGNREQLEHSLEGYPGTMLIVSHDRYLISRLANCILEINNKEINLYRQTTYEEYLAMKEKNLPGAKKEEKEGGASDSRAQKKETKKWHREQREKEKKKRQEIIELRRQKRILNQNLHRLEKDIEQEEENKSQLEHQLADPQNYDDFQKIREMNEQLETCQQKIRNMYEEWEEIAESLENMPEEETVGLE